MYLSEGRRTRQAQEGCCCGDPVIPGCIHFRRRQTVLQASIPLLDLALVAAGVVRGACPLHVPSILQDGDTLLTAVCRSEAQYCTLLRAALSFEWESMRS
jgi:hypothetical protein